MLNTGVKDPLQRKIRRKLNRQKKAMMRQNLRSIQNPLDSETSLRVEMRTLKIAELMKIRENLKVQVAQKRDS